MSSEDVFRVDQVGTQITLLIREPDPNTPGQYLPVDLTNKDAVGIEFKRPNKTKFLYVDKALDPNIVPPPSTITIVAAPTAGTILFYDRIGVFNVKGLWAWRGVYREDVSGTTEDFPGSWIEKRVGE